MFVRLIQQHTKETSRPVDININYIVMVSVYGTDTLLTMSDYTTKIQIKQGIRAVMQAIEDVRNPPLTEA